MSQVPPEMLLWILCITFLSHLLPTSAPSSLFPLQMRLQESFHTGPSNVTLKWMVQTGQLPIGETHLRQKLVSLGKNQGLRDAKSSSSAWTMGILSELLLRHPQISGPVSQPLCLNLRSFPPNECPLFKLFWVVSLGAFCAIQWQFRCMWGVCAQVQGKCREKERCHLLSSGRVSAPLLTP